MKTKQSDADRPYATRETLVKWARHLNVDASGESGRISATEAYAIADYLENATDAATFERTLSLLHAEIAELKARAEQAEQDPDGYKVTLDQMLGHHKPHCPYSAPKVVLDLGADWVTKSYTKPCTCGFDALLGKGWAEQDRDKWEARYLECTASLIEYGQHKPECMLKMSGVPPHERTCDCGFSALLSCE